MESATVDDSDGHLLAKPLVSGVPVVCRSLSCTTELCACSEPEEDHHHHHHHHTHHHHHPNKNQNHQLNHHEQRNKTKNKKKKNSIKGSNTTTRMILSNSSASLLNANTKTYIRYGRSASAAAPITIPGDGQTGATGTVPLHQIWMDPSAVAAAGGGSDGNGSVGEREHWDKKIEFLLAVIGFAVDLGNVWRFPYICYRNGGGAFLIPYCIMLLFGGLPLFYLELALGQYYSSGCLTVWKRLCPIMKGLGYAICIIDIYMAMYYNTIIAWSLYYLFISLSSVSTMELPWQSCNNEWNTRHCRTMQQRRLEAFNRTADEEVDVSVSPAQEYFFNHVLHIDASSGIDSLGPIQPGIALCLMIVFVVVYFSLWKGVKSTGKAVWVTALMPYFVIFILLIRGTTLPGAADGIRYYLSPDWDKLYSLNVWIDAATQIFFSLGPGFGTLMALASYNKFHNNCYRDAVITSSINCLTSFVAGFATFSILGYMAKQLNKDISNVAANGPGLVFIVYPEALATMYGSVFFSILYFLMLITLGLDSTFGGLEAMITGLCDNYPNLLRRNREIFVAILILCIYLCALPTTTYGGNYLITLLDEHGTALSVLFVVFIETIAICWFYGSEKISNQIKEMLGHKPGLFWRACWRFVCPLFLGFIAFASLIQKQPLSLNGYAYPQWSVTVGWIITLSSLSCIPLYALYHVCYRARGSTIREKLINSYRPSVVTGSASVGQMPVATPPPLLLNNAPDSAKPEENNVGGNDLPITEQNSRLTGDRPPGLGDPV